jgi:L-ascorbate metabolism protein UlaG (beta-lactamase superfamily)
MLQMNRFWLLGYLALLALMAPATNAFAADPACRPDMASSPARFHRASLAAKEVRVTFVGHASFLIETSGGTTAVTDYNDYVRASVVPDVATMNKAHSTHFSRMPQSGITHLLPGWNPDGTGPARHDITLRDLRVRNVSTNIRSFSGTEYDANSIFVFEHEDLCIVHLGHLHHVLEKEHVRAIGRADIVLAPVDNGLTLDLEGMMDVLKSLSPRVVIPMHFFGPQTLERFISRASRDFEVDRRDQPGTTFSSESLPAKPTLIVLPGR